MKRFVNTKFFRTVQEMSQQDATIDLRKLKSMYDEFVVFVFSEYSSFQNDTAYRNSLVFTNSKLISIMKTGFEIKPDFLKTACLS